GGGGTRRLEVSDPPCQQGAEGHQEPPECEPRRNGAVQGLVRVGQIPGATGAGRGRIAGPAGRDGRAGAVEFGVMARQRGQSGLSKFSFEVGATSAVEFAQLIKLDIVRWRPIVKEAEFTLDN